MMDPLAPETLRFVGTRRLATCRLIANDLGANGPATVAEIVRRTGKSFPVVMAAVTKMTAAGWMRFEDRQVYLEWIADPFPAAD